MRSDGWWRCGGGSGSGGVCVSAVVVVVVVGGGGAHHPTLTSSAIAKIVKLYCTPKLATHPAMRASRALFCLARSAPISESLVAGLVLRPELGLGWPSSRRTSDCCIG